jgi:hypothetical protein
MGMIFNQLGNLFEVEKNKNLDHKVLRFHSLKQLLQFLGLVDLEHLKNNVAIMYPTMKNVATKG